jgi:hypothetical protein
MTGKWPTNEVDHKNNSKADNSWNNLREATSQQNKYNKPRRSDNKSGKKGVYWNIHAKKWRSDITVAGRKRLLGYFDNIDEAAKAYVVAAEKHHGEFAGAA